MGVEVMTLLEVVQAEVLAGVGVVVLVVQELVLREQRGGLVPLVVVREK